MPEICDRCGAQIPKEQTIYEDGYVICVRCQSFNGTCQICANRYECKFETDLNPLPKQIQQTIQQGNMIMQTVTINPERVKATCVNGCTCYGGEKLGCHMQQDGTCGNYSHEAPQRAAYQNQ